MSQFHTVPLEVFNLKDKFRNSFLLKMPHTDSLTCQPTSHHVIFSLFYDNNDWSTFPQQLGILYSLSSLLVLMYKSPVCCVLEDFFFFAGN